jgi:iron complex outermembrane receptor protein
MLKSRRQRLLLFTACTVAWGIGPDLPTWAQGTNAPTRPAQPGASTASASASAPGTTAAKNRRQRRTAAARARSRAGTVQVAQAGTSPGTTAPGTPGNTGAGSVSGGTTPVGVNPGANFGATPGSGSGGGGSSGNPTTDAAQAGTTVNVDLVQKTYRELLLKEQNVPSAVSEVGQAEIQSTGLLGSVQSLLKQTPSVNSYQPGVGQNTPELTVRGIRYAELSTTLNGIPINDLLSNAQGAFLSNNIGNPVSIEQLSSVNVYPGTAPVDVQGFGTNGGTIAYQTLKPTPDRFAEVFAGVGSFNLSHYGFDLNTGALPWLGNTMVFMKYDQSQNGGFIANTNARYRDFLFSADKPYLDGTSHVTLDVIYNNASGYLPPSPVPTDLIARYGYTYNYPKNETLYRQDNDFLTVILGDSTYVNEHLILSGKVFYVGTDSKISSQVNPNLIYPSYPYQPNFQVPFYAYGPIGPTAASQFGSPYYKPGLFSYDPLIANPGADPTDPSSYGPGEAAEISYNGTETYGVAPKANIFLPYNNITVGGLFAREIQNTPTTFFGADLSMPQILGYNSFSDGSGHQERAVFQGYVQDRIDILHNRLHIEPGIAWEGIATTNNANNPLGRRPYSLQAYDKAIEPYIGVAYDLPYHLTAYASYGRSASFPQITDYTLGSLGATNAPHLTILHAYEAGIRYDTPRLYVNLDYFYQRTTSAIGFYANYLTNEFRYSNEGENQYRGVEASVQYRVTPQFQVFGNGSWNDAQYLKNYSASTTPFQDQFGYGFQDTPLSSIPAWLFNIGFDYEQGPWSLRVWDQYTGQQYTTYNISVTNPNPLLQAATTTNTAYKLPEYNTVNLLASYTLPLDNRFGLKSLKFTLNAQNIFNMHAYQYRYISNFSYAGAYSSDNYYTSAFIQPPAAVIFDVTARF